MRTPADTLWVCLLGYAIHVVTGAVFHPSGSQTDKAGDLSSLNKILVYGGRDCAPHSQPWMAALFLKNKFSCAGVLVHPRWVLSVGHCYDSFDTIGLGLHNVDPRQEGLRQMFVPSLTVRHPQFRPMPQKANDLMLIKLNRPAVETDTVRPIRIASQCAVPGTDCLFSGWGLTSNGKYPSFLQCMDTTVMSMLVCRPAYPWLYFYKMFCAGGEESNKGTCHGDSGGPLVCNGVLQGINTGGSTPCGTLGVPDVYVELCKYKDWIEKIISIR